MDICSHGWTSWPIQLHDDLIGMAYGRQQNNERGKIVWNRIKASAERWQIKPAVLD